MKSPIQLFIAIAVLLAAATVTAQVYKWVDKDGKVQYSDIPPSPDAKGVEPKKVDVRAAAGPAVPANAKDAPKDSKATNKATPKDAPKSLADRAKDSDKRRADEAAAAKKSADDDQVVKANQARCKDATRYMAELNSGRPIGGTDDAGGRKILDDEGRNAEIVKVRAVMNESCK